MKLHSYFKNFLDNVNLDDGRIEKLNKRVDAITSFLSSHEVFGELFIDVIAQGSYAHRTIIKPVGDSEYDADVLLSMKEHPDWTPAQYTTSCTRPSIGKRTGERDGERSGTSQRSRSALTCESNGIRFAMRC